MLDPDVSLATVLGHAFEHFVKAGSLRALKDLGPHPGDEVVAELGLVSLDRITRTIERLGVTDPSERQRTDRFLEHMTGWASIAGYGLMRDYLNHITGGSPKRADLVWLACPVGTHHFELAGVEQNSRRRIDEALRTCLNVNSIPVGPGGRGRFERADWISVLRVGGKYFLLVLEFSLFATTKPEFLPDPDDPAATFRQYQSVLSTLRRKGAFAHLNLSLADDFFQIGPDFAEYLKGVRRADKPAAKLLQGCAYATDFLDRLRDAGKEWLRGEVHVISVTDRGMQGFGATFRNRERLRPFAEAVWSQSFSDGEDWGEIQARQRKEAFRGLIRSFPAEARDSLRKFRTAVLHPTDELPATVDISEFPTGIANPADPVDQDLLAHSLSRPVAVDWIGSEHFQKLIEDVRDLKPDLRSLHARLVRLLLDRDYLDHPVPVIALTGHPGIGKTTAIRDALMEGSEGFLFLYFSPRIQISQDVLKNFDRDSPNPVVTLTTNSETIRSFINQRETERRSDPALPSLSGAVIYGGREVELPDNLPGFAFVPQRVAQTFESGAAPDQKRGYQEISSQDISPRALHRRGVLSCLAEGIKHALKHGHTRIVGAVSTQALKKTGDNRTSLDALGDIVPKFQKAPTTKKLDALAHDIPHIVVMLDEITGSSEGVSLLHDLVGKLDEWFIAPFRDIGRESPFRIRVVVADASLTDENVTGQFLAETSSELSKIVISPAGTPSPLSLGTFMFQGKATPLLNASSFPATELELVYRLALLPPPTDSSPPVEAGGEELRNFLNGRLLEAAVTALKKAEQIIVFVQDISRLDELACVLKEEHGLSASDVLVINSRIRSSERARIIEDREHLTAKVVLMTSSASRGISFPKTSVILAEIPRFAPEQSLMEIVQLVYRGRGQAKKPDGTIIDGDRANRRLEFFLTETLPPHKIEERFNDLVSMAVLTRAAVMTRIMGNGEIGKRRVSVVPVGSKQVESSDATDSEEIIQFRVELEKEFNAAAAESLRGVCANTIEQFHRVFGVHGSQKIININPTGSSDKLDSVAIREEWVRKRLVPHLRSGLDGIFEIREFPTQASFCSGALIEEREGEATDELALQTGKVPEAEIHRLLGSLRALKEGHITPSGGPAVSLGIRSRNLMTGAAKLIDLLKSLLNSRSSGERISDRRRIELRNQSGLWLAQPSLCFSLFDRMATYFREASPEIHSEWRDTLLELARLHFGAIIPVAPIIAQYDDIPFLVFRSGGVEMYRNQLFSPTSLRATNELQLLNILLLDEGLRETEI